MQSTVERTSRYLQNALDTELELYERYVLSPKVLAQYVELTKQALLAAITDAFDRKIEEISLRDSLRADKLNTISARTPTPSRL